MCKVPAMAGKGRWRILLIVKVGSSSQTAEVVGGRAHNCAKIPNYCMSWISISEVSLFSSCCREIRVLTVKVSQYLTNFLAFLKGRGGRRAFLFFFLCPHEHLPLSTHTHMKIKKKPTVINQDFLRINLLDDHRRLLHQCHSCLALCVQRALCAL